MSLSPTGKTLSVTSGSWSLSRVTVTGKYSDGSSSVHGNGFTWKLISGPGKFNASTLTYTTTAKGTAVLRCTLTIGGISKSANYTITVQ